MEIIVTHKNADFDALASLFAATMLYPDAVAVLPSSINQNVRAFLSLHKDIFPLKRPNEIDLKEVRQLIVVDTNRWMRLEGMNGLTHRNRIDIHLWDHHTEIGDITPTWACQELVGAATTLLVRQMEKTGKLLDPIEATLLLAGIYEDTGHLTFPATTSHDARASAFLLDQGADLNVLQTILRSAYGPRQKDVLLEMLGQSSRIKFNGFSISISKVDMEGYIPGLSMVLNMYRDIVNVDVAFGAFRDMRQDRCIVIGRSDVDGVDVGAMMRTMGGGGRPEAGSAMLKSVSPEGVEAWIRELIENHHRSAIQISDLMSFPVLTLSPEDKVEEVQKLLKDKGCSGAPIMEGNKLVGIISNRDLDKLKSKSQRISPVKAFMSRNVMTITPDCSVKQAIRLMVKHDIGRLPVMENANLIGILTRSDAMLYYYDLAPD